MNANSNIPWLRAISLVLGLVLFICVLGSGFSGEENYKYFITLFGSCSILIILYSGFISFCYPKTWFQWGFLLASSNIGFSFVALFSFKESNYLKMLVFWFGISLSIIILGSFGGRIGSAFSRVVTKRSI